MLDLIRRKQQTFLIKVIFWVIIAAFVGTGVFVWGVGERDTWETGAATVNGTKIDYEEYQRTYSNLYRLYQEMYRETFTPEMERQMGLRRQALDIVIDQALLLQEAERRGITVSRQELIDAIAQIPAFQDNGAFNRERYLQVLTYQRLNPEIFESLQRRELLVDKVRRQIQESVTVTADDVEREYRDRNEKINLGFLRLDPTQFEGKVEISDEELKDFFEARREEFRTTEKIALQYVTFDPSALDSEITLTEGELEGYYRRNLDRFEIQEQVKASHILIGVPQEASEGVRDEKRKEAEKILAQIRQGESFSELAKKHSDDPGSASKGGDLGHFPRGSTVPSFEQAAFVLRPGEISSLVETPFGFHIIRVEDRIEAGIRPLSLAKEEVEAGARADKARQLAFEKAMDAYNINRKGGSLEAAARAAGLTVKETPLFDRQELANGLGGASELPSAAFSLQPGELARPISAPEGVVLYALKERRESRLPELSDIRSDVESAFRREKAVDLAQEAARKALASLEQGRSLNQVGRDLGQKPEETGWFTRAYGVFVPGLGTAGELSEAAFSLSAEAPVANQVFEQDGFFVVATLKERQEADMTALDAAQRELLRQDVLARNQGDAIEDKLEQLRNQAVISIAPTVASSLEGERG